MSNPVLTSTNSKLDTRVKEPSVVVPLPTLGVGPGTPNRFNYYHNKVHKFTINHIDKKSVSDNIT